MAETPKFEEGLSQLEQLVEDLEGGELDLDESMKRFEKGVKLTQQLNGVLDQAARKVEKLSGQGADERIEPWDESGEAPEAAAPKKAPRAKAKGKDQDTLF